MSGDDGIFTDSRAFTRCGNSLVNVRFSYVVAFEESVLVCKLFVYVAEKEVCYVVVQ